MNKETLTTEIANLEGELERGSQLQRQLENKMQLAQQFLVVSVALILVDIGFQTFLMAVIAFLILIGAYLTYKRYQDAYNEVNEGMILHRSDLARLKAELLA